LIQVGTKFVDRRSRSN